jgi:Mn2+/Fe2+ NRAMP family transporter
MTEDRQLPKESRSGFLQTLGPGILVAATGVGAGDLAGGALAGSRLKLAVLWVVLVGAALKFVLSEGLARWQLRTGLTVTDGVFRATHPIVRWLFLTYVAAWSFCIGGMLMSACGECAQAILPIGNASFGRIVHGCLHSLIAIILIRAGGFRVFEVLMTVCIGIMFVTVLLVAALSSPDWFEVGRGLTVPTVPHADGKGIAWTLTLMAGVGGTLTMLCYGTWIRQTGRVDISALKACRIDLAAGYLMTALFGIAMVILGSRLPVDQGLNGANLITSLSANMQSQLGEIGTAAAWMFRIGAWGAVFSSLLGVWQSVPELICDMLPGQSRAVTSHASPQSRYTLALLTLGIAPCFMLPFSLATVQKIAGVTGAIFIPIFALILLILEYTDEGKQSGYRNRWLSRSVLVPGLLLFGYLALQKVAAQF